MKPCGSSPSRRARTSSGTLSPKSDRRAIADKLFLPAARDVILPHRMGIHNIQCWKNSAVDSPDSFSATSR